VPFLAEAGVTLQKADLLNLDEMEAVIAGKNIIFHVAAWLSRRTKEAELAQKINADINRDLIALAAKAGVDRFVLVSSVASYGVPHQEMMDETQPVRTDQPELYGRTKAMGEVAAIEAARAHGMELTIIRPGMVYGPRSYSWTRNMYAMVRKGIPTLFGRAEGYACPVYIDNLCDMLILSSVKSEAVGEAFNASDPPIDWNQFFGYYGKMLNKKPRRLPMPLAKGLVVVNGLFNLGLPLTHERLLYFDRKTVFPTTKAENLLGFKTRVSIEEGMARSEAWLREIGDL
jgi:nucleoside-diphosphate-sugar epimerase